MRVLVCTISFCVLLAWTIFSFVSFISEYSNEVINISTLVKDGIMLIISLSVLSISSVVFLIYIFVDQIQKLKNVLDALDASTDNVESAINNFNDNLEMLM